MLFLGWVQTVQPPPLLWYAGWENRFLGTPKHNKYLMGAGRLTQFTLSFSEALTFRFLHKTPRSKQFFHPFPISRRCLLMLCCEKLCGRVRLCKFRFSAWDHYISWLIRDYQIWPLRVLEKYLAAINATYEVDFFIYLNQEWHIKINDKESSVNLF